jgi:hypothetical protein
MPNFLGRQNGLARTRELIEHDVAARVKSKSAWPHAGQRDSPPRFKSASQKHWRRK